MKLHLDTHAVVWLYTGELKRIPKNLLSKMEQAELSISPPVIFELALLHQIGKTKDSEDKVISFLQREIKLKVDNVDCRKLFEKASDLTWTRDPFDRMIVACAQVSQVPLVTKDLHIHENFKQALW